MRDNKNKMTTHADDVGVWFIGDAISTIKPKEALPDGSTLVAETWNEPDYPGVRISLKKSDGADEAICFAEFNTTKPEGRQLCICAYARDIDEPVFYESYNDPGSPSPNI